MLAPLISRFAYKLWLADWPQYCGHDAAITRDGSLIVYRTFLWPRIFKRCEAVYINGDAIPIDAFLGKEEMELVYQCTFTTYEDKAIISYVTGGDTRTRIIFGK